MLKTSPVLAGSVAVNGSTTSYRRGHATPQSPSSSSLVRGSSPSVPSCQRLSLNKVTLNAASNGLHHERRTTYNPAYSPNLQHDTLDSKQKQPAGLDLDSAKPEHKVLSSSLGSSTKAQPQPVLPQSSQKLMSPNKRRVSPGCRSENVTPPIGGPSRSPTSPSAITTSKRARTDRIPPKLLPQQYEFCPVDDIVELIAHMLAELIATNDAIRISTGGLTRFHSRTAPAISVRDYLHRLARHATLTPPLLLAMVYYIDRLCALYPEFTINTLTVHRFLITAATVAAKGLSDSFWNNTTYARVGGVRLAELKLLELEFLHRVDWKIVPNPEVLVAYYRGLVERTPQYILEQTSFSDESSDDDDDNLVEDEENAT